MQLIKGILMAELWQMIETFSNMPIKELEDIVNNKSDEYEEEAIRTAKRIFNDRKEELNTINEEIEETTHPSRIGRKERVQLINKIKLTTAPSLEGYKIIETIDIVTAECVFGMNIFRDFFAGISDFFGGRSKASQKILRDARMECLFELRMEAQELGANAVIAVDLDYSEISGKGKGMLFLVASGTAVKVEKSN